MVKEVSCSENPRTLDNLGLRLPDSVLQLGRRKDYKSYALYYLIEMDVVRVMEDERVCLVEENLTEEPASDKAIKKPENDERAGRRHRVLQFPIRHSNQGKS